MSNKPQFHKWYSDKHVFKLKQRHFYLNIKISDKKDKSNEINEFDDF